MRPLLVCVLLAGCWHGDAPPPAEPAPPPAPVKAAPAPQPKTQSELAFEAMLGFKDQMCRCKDKACADRVQEDLVQWSTEMAKSSDMRPGTFTDEQMRAMQDLGSGYAECMMNAMQATP